jgi:hypothetical protein
MRSARWMTSILTAIMCALIVPVTVSGCSTEKPTAGAPDPGLRGAWVLIGGHDGYGAMNLLHQDITLTVSGSTRATGRGSCSNYTATIYGTEKSLWVTASTPPNFSCASADQSVLQLEYLTDLAGVQHSFATADGLELAGPRVDLRFARATHLSLTQLVDTTWELRTGDTINLHGPFTSSTESGGYIRFESKTSLSVVTKCVSFTGNYRQDADDLVTSHVLAIDTVGCDRSTDPAASDFARVLNGGFRFSVAGYSLNLTSSRAGLTLGFNELGTP